MAATGKYYAIQAENSDEALALFGAGPAIRLVLSDIPMPKMDGFAFLKEIRKTCSKTPVIMLTGFNMPDTDTSTLSMVRQNIW